MIRPGIATALLLAFPGLFIGIFFIVPLASSVAVSLNLPDISVATYQRLIDVPVYRAVYWRTIKVAFVVTLVCLALGCPCAYYIASLRPRARTVAIALVALPFMLSVLVRNYVWITLLQDTGLINRVLVEGGWMERPVRLMYNEFGVMVAMTNMLVPYMIFPVLSALLAIPSDLNTASASLGAGALRTFIRVTVPLTAAGTAAGALLTFIVGLGFYITPAMLGGTREMMVANMIAFNVRDVLNWPLAFSLSSTLLASTIVFYLIYRALLPSAAAIRSA